jgi:multicomponent Na+:H+ antiporter subunit G
MSETIGALLLIAGAFFVLVAALGVLRLPDVFMRMHAGTKAGTLGAGLVLVAAAFVFGELGVAVKSVVVFVFLLLTAPVAAHVLGRAAYYDRAELWDRTHHDDLRGRYDEVRHGRPDPAPDELESDH